jgi:hypothetical protein
MVKKFCRAAPRSRDPTPRSGLAGAGDPARSRGTALHNAEDYRRSALVQPGHGDFSEKGEVVQHPGRSHHY